MATTTEMDINKRNQLAFDDLLITMMENLEIITEKYNLQDIEYKEHAEGLMKIKNLQAQLKTNQIFITMERRVRRERNNQRRQYRMTALEDKINNEDYTNCPKCNRFVLNAKGSLKQHQKTNVCINTLQAKKTTHAFRKVITPRIAEVQQVLNIRMYKQLNECPNYIDYAGNGIVFTLDMWGGIDRNIYWIMKRKDMESGSIFDILKAEEEQEDEDEEDEDEEL